MSRRGFRFSPPLQAGKPVDATIENLSKYMEPNDIIIDGGNEWYENTERRQALVAEKGLRMLGMGVSGGEEGARHGPSLMPGGVQEAYAALEPVVTRVAAQVDDGPCVTYIGPGGAGNYVKMVHNGIEYGDMQLIAECYDVLKVVGGLTNEELAATFDDWNKGELDSFLIEITANIFKMRDAETGDGHLVDKILDKTGMKGTGKWTVQQAAELSVAAPVIASSLDSRFLSGLKERRVEAARFYEGLGLGQPARAGPGEDKAALVRDARDAMYCAKVCSYAQGMQLIKAKSDAMGWGVNLSGLARIWKGGCIIRARFLDEIRAALVARPDLPNLLLDPGFGRALAERHHAWRRVVAKAVAAGVAMPATTAALSYFDAFRRERLPANLVQAQRDYFGSHTFERVDREGSFHAVWSDKNSADSITTSGYKA